MSDVCALDAKDWAIKFAEQCSEKVHSLSLNSFVIITRKPIPYEILEQHRNFNYPVVKFTIECSEKDHNFCSSRFVGINKRKIPDVVFRQLKNIAVDSHKSPVRTNMNSSKTKRMSRTNGIPREQHYQATYDVELFQAGNKEVDASIKIPVNTMFSVFWERLRIEASTIARTTEFDLIENGKKITDEILNVRVQGTYRFTVYPRVPKSHIIVYSS